MLITEKIEGFELVSITWSGSSNPDLHHEIVGITVREKAVGGRLIHIGTVEYTLPD